MSDGWRQVQLPDERETLSLPLGVAVPGHLRRQGQFGRVRKRRKTLRYRIKCLKQNKTISLLLAIALWYNLGILSIGTSKVLLSSPLYGRVHPLLLTLQQHIIGSSILLCLMRANFLGSAGLQKWRPQALRGRRLTSAVKQSSLSEMGIDISHPLLLAGMFFSIGFYATNCAFAGSSAAFVETIKAAEPITSAVLAVSWGVETLTFREVASLITIVLGVILSTVGNQDSNGDSDAATFKQSMISCATVMTANLCFSFRGLCQKVLRQSSDEKDNLDDLNLQYRMQQIGAYMLLVPSMLILAWSMFVENVFSGVSIDAMWQYAAMSLLNGFAFTCYTLASTYILTRISFVHHAAFNCVRRIFAIIVTSIAFGVSITSVGVLGICISFIGFVSFTYFKATKTHSTLLPTSR